MKQFLFFIGMLHATISQAQKIDSIYVDLYTDSLKKGTFNYINIDGLLTNGRYLPLDTTQLFFSASAGKFSGNSLWIEPDFREEKVNVKVILKKDPSVFKQFDIYVKKKPDNERLKTADEIINEVKNNRRSKKKD